MVFLADPLPRPEADSVSSPIGSRFGHAALLGTSSDFRSLPAQAGIIAGGTRNRWAFQRRRKIFPRGKGEIELPGLSPTGGSVCSMTQ